MAIDYVSLRADNERRYGTDIGRIGQMLLADRYDDRTHFIFELLQNAEDALSRRAGWNGSRKVIFTLSNTELRIAHFGQPFNEQDVRGICGIAEGTKGLTAIGRFGIGFKSVYALTHRPEVHSGEEDFAIETFVRPVAVPVIAREPDETIFVVPLREGDKSAHAEIVSGLQRLGPRALLFLRQIEEIGWSVEGGASGLYLRGKPETLGENVRRISLIGEKDGEPDVAETWLVFSHEARTQQNKHVGYVEIAFSVSLEEGSGRWSVQKIADSSLVVFFPTILATHLGFLVQGPYRTTPSRDNVPRNDPWNQYLVRETAGLLVESLYWLRDHELLEAGALQCLPLDRAKFSEVSMFATLFEAVHKALATEDLLPAFGGAHVAATRAKLARTQDLREHFAPSQLAGLFGTDGDLFWLNSDITQDRTPDLREYLMRELGVAEVTPETMLSMVSEAFLRVQSDEWVLKLYEFLSRQPSLLHQGRFKDLPLVRLEDGRHVKASLLTFLPGAIKTRFPTVRRAACATDEARKFLVSLGLTEPDPVDAVIDGVLLKYMGDSVDVDDEGYENDIQRILTAFYTDSKAKRELLLMALEMGRFVKVLDSGGGVKSWSKPDEVYIGTERLKALFAGIDGVLFVDDSHRCLCGEGVRQLLEACGATRYLKPVKVEVTWEKRLKLRERAGTTNTLSPQKEKIDDHSLCGLGSLLETLAILSADAASRKAKLLWEALCELEQRQRSVFTGKYDGYYKCPRSCEFEPSFVELLNNSTWVPGKDGKMERPAFVVFHTLGWAPNPFLLSKIRFKPSQIEKLAQETGIEPGALDLLKELGLTKVAELRARLGIKDPPPPPDGTGDDGGEGGRERRKTKGRPFISYVAVHPDEKEPDPSEVGQEDRMELEEKAIQHILKCEPTLERTPAGNAGYDLFESGEERQLTRWIEVKAMKACLEDRPVGLSRAQFECAREHGDAYWLYVVEYAEDAENARVVRIQDPVGKARTFTFDRGWMDVAEIEVRLPPQVEPESAAMAAPAP